MIPYGIAGVLLKFVPQLSTHYGATNGTSQRDARYFGFYRNIYAAKNWIWSNQVHPITTPCRLARLPLIVYDEKKGMLADFPAPARSQTPGLPQFGTKMLC